GQQCWDSRTDDSGGTRADDGAAGWPVPRWPARQRRALARDRPGDRERAGADAAAEALTRVRSISCLAPSATRVTRARLVARWRVDRTHGWGEGDRSIARRPRAHAGPSRPARASTCHDRRSGRSDSRGRTSRPDRWARSGRTTRPSRVARRGRTVSVTTAPARQLPRSLNTRTTSPVDMPRLAASAGWIRIGSRPLIFVDWLKAPTSS